MKKSSVPNMNYVEMTLRDFAIKFPQAFALFPPVFDLTDDKYIVRITDGHVEIGYREDDWFTE